MQGVEYLFKYSAIIGLSATKSFERLTPMRSDQRKKTDSTPRYLALRCSIPSILITVFDFGQRKDQMAEVV